MKGLSVPDYDDTILRHYRTVANEAGDQPASTMADERTRQLETELIEDFVREVLHRWRRRGKEDEQLQCVDVGCGNGYTLSVLNQVFPRLKLTGFEYTPELRDIARRRFPEGTIQILPADVRGPKFAGDMRADILICQRVLINLLDFTDQAAALRHLVQATNPGGYLLLIEAFQSGLERLNEARAEFDLEAIPPAHHNLYLPDDFFSDQSELHELQDSDVQVARNFLSTHYFVTRVFHPLMLGNRPFKRNSHWVSFFSQALLPNIGDYSPIRAYAFQRR